MKKSTLLIMLTAIILAVAFFGKYVDNKIDKSATTILNDRLVPVPLLSHRFDYYGTTIDNSLSMAASNIDTFIARKGELLETRKETQKMWDEYKLTYLASDEDSVVKLADVKMVKLDKQLDDIYSLAEVNKAKADSVLRGSTLKSDARSIADDVNFLLDLQLRVGKEETIGMLATVKVFSNFMTGAIALAVMLLGSILYSIYQDRKDAAISTKTKAGSKKPSGKRVVKKSIKKK